MFDAYVRMPIEELAELAPLHLVSEIEREFVEHPSPVSAAPVQGITEWSAEGPRTLTFGWDWTYEPSSRQLLGRWSALRTNLLVVDALGVALGVDCLRQSVAWMMTCSRWKETVANTLFLKPG